MKSITFDTKNFLNEIWSTLIEIKLEEKSNIYNLKEAEKDISNLQKITWKEIDLIKSWLSQKWLNKIETKAWEVISTTNTTYWQALQFTTYNDYIMQVAVKNSWLLNLFSKWNLNTQMWRLLWSSHEINYDWVRKRMKRSIPRTSWAIVPRTPEQIQDINKIIVSRQRLQSVVDISSNILDNNILWENWILDYALQQINLQLAENIDHMILNSDILTTIANINTEWVISAVDDIAHWVADWIRKLWIANSFNYTAWALNESVFQKALELLDQMWDKDTIFVVPTTIKNKMLWISSMLTIDKVWPLASILTWTIWNIYWQPVFVSPEYVSKEQASWKVSATTWNNIVSSICAINTRALQYWFFWNDKLDIESQWKEISIWFYTDFWFWIIPEVAWYWKSVSMVRNILI